ncbi:MAG: hypothetical protein WD990_05090 [Acidimicrobiia bacterium]
MTSRRLLAIAFVALLVACNPSTATTTTGGATSTSSTSSEPVPARDLAYGYEAGQSLRYDVMVTQDITFTATGDAPGFGDASLPIDADLVTESQGHTTYAIEEGQSPDTFTIDIAARFPETRVAGSVNGDTVNSLEEGGVEADLARIEPVDVTIAVNEVGRILEDEFDDATVLGADLAALTGLTNDLFAVPVGPLFERGSVVTIGDRWETESSLDGKNGPVEARSESEITDIVDGVFVIETTTVTDTYQVDFSEEFRNLYLEFAELESDGEIPPEVRDGLDAIEFVITVDESSTVEVAHFDPSDGLVRSSTKTSATRLTMTFRAPDDSEETSGFEITLDLTQMAVFTLDR